MSLSTTRAEMEARLGRPIASRPLKASRWGETHELTFVGGLKASFRGQELRCLVGSTFGARSHVLELGISREQLRQELGEPGQTNDWEWIYTDFDRRAQAVFFFEEGKLTGIAIGRVGD